jgi:transcriptional regulator with XRE-family HTH domain
MKKARAYSPLTIEAARLLGARIRATRRERRWTVEELAERVGVAHPTIRKVERGDLTVSLGAAFEAAAILGVPLFADDPARRSLEAARLEDRLTVLPARVRRPVRIDNDF